MKLAWPRAASTSAPPAPSGPDGRGVERAQSSPDPELIIERDRLTERFALMQSELGGLFYEMAIRDHVQMDVLIEKAAALQRLDAELGQLEHLLSEDGGAIGGHCSNCGAPHARGAAFCSRCATALSNA